MIGQRLIPRLVQAGHVVGGLTRSPSKRDLLSRLGAEPILCDVFNREALIYAVGEFKPAVVLHEVGAGAAAALRAPSQRPPSTQSKTSPRVSASSALIVDRLQT